MKQGSDRTSTNNINNSLRFGYVDFGQSLKRSLGDPIAEEALNKLNQNKIPLYLNRYIGRSVGLDQYLDDYQSTFNDSRFAGFDVYEFSDLAHATSDGLKLNEIKNQIIEIRKKSIQLGLL